MPRVVSLALLLTAASAQAQSGWSQKGDTGSQILVDVSAPDAQNVFVVGFEFGGGALPTPVARVFASADGGQQFTDISGPVASGAGFAQARAVFFIDAQVGWAAVGSKLWRTLDRGATWASSDVGFDIGAIHFFDARRGLVAGDGGQVKGTSDGGASWAAVSTPTGPMLRSLHFVDDTHGWAAGHEEDDAALPDSAALLITSDGGRTWSKGASLPANQGIAAVEFLCDGQTGWVAAFEHPTEDEWKAVLYRTVDGGLTLQNMELPLQVGTLSFGNAPIRAGLPLAMHWEDASRGRMVAAAFLMKSSSSGGGSSSGSAVWRVVDYVTGDGGASWTKTDLGTITMSFPNLPPSDGTFLAGLMRDLHGGWIVGDQGRVWASELACADDEACPADATCSDATLCVDATPDCAIECPAGQQLVDGECVTENAPNPDGGTLPDPDEPGATEETPAGCECGVASGAGWALLLLLGMRVRSSR